jgi:hypothetical protein
MKNDIQIPLILTTEECLFISEFCEESIGIDLSLKFRIALMNSQDRVTIKVSRKELSGLINVLGRKAKLKTVSHGARQWAFDLAKWLLNQIEKFRLVH